MEKNFLDQHLEIIRMSKYFPQELWIEILKRLDPKTLISCSTLSKSWHVLITSPLFKLKHLRYALEKCQTEKDLPSNHCDCDLNNIDQQCFSLHNENDPSRIKLPQELIDVIADYHWGDFRTVGFCNGLICLAIDNIATNRQTIIIWNPSIRKFTKLPPLIFKRSLIRNMALIGFGAHFSNGEYEYKIVRILFPTAVKVKQIRKAIVPVVEIFSTREGKWRRIQNINIQCRALNSICSPALVNGAAHWIVFKPNGDHVPKFLPSILAFNFGDESFTEMALPDAFITDFSGKGYLIKHEECLAAVKFVNEPVPFTFRVWTMREYGIQESWTMRYYYSLTDNDINYYGITMSNDHLIMPSQNLLASSKPYQLQKLAFWDWPLSYPESDYIQTLALFERHPGISVDTMILQTDDIPRSRNGDEANAKRTRKKRLKKM